MKVLAMEDRAQEFQAEEGVPRVFESPALRIVGALERVRPESGHPSARFTRAARFVLEEHRLRQEEAMGLRTERAMLVYRSGDLISRALGARLDNVGGRNEENARLFSKASAASSEATTMRVSGSYTIGPRTVLDSMVEGTSVDLMELRLRLVHSPPLLQQLGEFHTGRLSLTAGTNLHTRHRLTLESMMGSEDNKHSLSNVVSTDFTSSALAWGVATSHKFGKSLSVFSRYSSDHHSGRRMILQAVQRCGRNTISPICSVASKGRMQAGITWKSTFPCKGDNNGNGFVQLKALCNQKGVFSVFVKAQFGQPADCYL